MHSNTFNLLRREHDPISLLDSLVAVIVNAENTIGIREDLRTFFDASLAIKTDRARRWGINVGMIKDIRIQGDFADTGFFVEYEYESYSRGCHMGTSRYEVFVPDNLMKLYEEWRLVDDGHATEDDGSPVGTYSAFEKALNTFMQDRIIAITIEATAEAQKENKRQQELEDLQEQNERARLAELLKKYPDATS